MEIGSISNSYTDIIQDILTSQSNEIKRNVIMEQLNMKVAMASLAADSIISSISGYELDSVIPEDSTISVHV